MMSKDILRKILLFFEIYLYCQTRTLPLMLSIITDVIIRYVLHVEATSGDLVACHKVGQIVHINEPPPIIAKFLYFGQNNQI